VGNVDVVRDFSDVRDVVAAYVAALERGVTGEAYNVCSGVGVSVRHILETLIALSGLNVEIAVAKERVRGADLPRVVGCAEKLHAATGWAPRHALRETLNEVLADWRERCDA
jgi:GDP-4-dehydro-6-deoxy-D-mannose reductase